MVEALQMFLFLFKSKYRRKCAWFSPFLCSVLIVLLFCHGVLTKCTNSSDNSCINGNCVNESCECFDGWQGPECQYCGGKVNLTDTSGIITDGPYNYSVSTQCTWVLIPPRIGSTPPTIRIRLESFATECGWDHLYVYDGDSVKAKKLLAVYSGVMKSEDSGWTRQVIARSGSVLLHFFSDDAYAMEGFNITYAAYSCPSNDHMTNCSNHGDCEDGTCRCEQGWTGVACDEPICPGECNSEYGGGRCTMSGCVCESTRAGSDCSLSTRAARWTWAWRERGEGAPQARGALQDKGAPSVAGAQLLEWKGDLVRVGGEAFAEAPMLYIYRAGSQTWEVITTHGVQPQSRASHSAVLYRDQIIMFGGALHTTHHISEGLAGLEGRAGEVTNEVWRITLDELHPAWYNSTPAACPTHKHAPFKRCGGLSVSGHSAVVVEMGATNQPVMLVFFGHSPQYGYLHIVQEYYIEENAWAIAATRGWSARAGFGHSAAYDQLSKKVYVHGGLVSESEATQAPSASLFEYDVEQRLWRPLPSAPIPRYLHAALFVSPGIMIVLGGNAHNDSAAHASVSTHSAACYCSQAYTYDVRCRKWREMPAPRGSARAAHAAVLASNGALFYGGFDGRLHSDALLFSTGAKCSTHTDELSCLKSAEKSAVACGWRAHDQICLPLQKVGWKESLEGVVKTCEVEPVIEEAVCYGAEWCGACVAAGCAWCGECVPRPDMCMRRRHAHTATTIEECGANPEGREACSRYHSCTACHAHHHYNSNEEQRLCYWEYDTAKCRPANTSDDIRSSSSASAACSAPCSTFKTCANCTAEECIWCASAATCVDKNAYGASFPLGGCRVWATANGSGSCGAGGGCAAHVDCASCLREPACGWCHDGTPGGVGACLRGGHAEPTNHTCPRHRWHFTRCPRCQCNGHSTCDSEDRCIQPCAGRAAGDHCQLCARMHYGKSLNGLKCLPCECNAQATACAPDTGRCFCSTKGLAGDKCDKCDNTNHYHADMYNKGACYYDLAVDYQFTFNLSKKEDRHLSAINFRNAPVKPDVDADFSITCSAHARMNLTVRTRSDPSERSLFTDVNCTNFRYKFTKADHQFGVEDNVTLTTFFVYVYDFKPPLWIQISFSQYPKLNLQQFFITFSSCFLLLLMLAAALWKIKQKYDMYRRRQRLFVEMEQMASRPFSQVCVELERVNTQVSGPGGGGGPGGPGGPGGGVPAPVALEPCAGGRAAVLSLLVRLPTGGTGRAPPLGGLAVASAIVTLGHAPPHHKRPAR